MIQNSVIAGEGIGDAKPLSVREALPRIAVQLSTWFHSELLWCGVMSDGTEERHENRIRQEQERREDPEDRIDFDDVDEGEPERADS